ncbi:hypothetical protein Kpho01_63460 [Kitasatospora phosalacinea]|uniref:Uncharacterized protein n=1 Tax=Kitasatospora phosalacinea TaxID=2065 RepID=A0A9W6UT81_9ACTN|nr:hypothetical protein Kpho01_63460 [Kitasatospora phosalacinea]
MSELLRVDQGEDEVADQRGGDEETRCVLGAHSFSTPRAIRAMTANTATVTPTWSRSDMASTKVARNGDRRFRRLPEPSSADPRSGGP